MWINLRRLLAIALITSFATLCNSVPYYLHDLPTKDVILRAYVVATVGLIRHCFGVYKHLADDIDREEKGAQNIERVRTTTHDAILNVAAIFGVTEEDMEATLTVPDMEVLMKNKTINRNLNPTVVNKQVDDVMQRCVYFGKLIRKHEECKSEERKNAKHSYDESYKLRKILIIDNLIRVEFPKVWMGPLHMIYQSLDIKNSPIEPGRILGMRLELWGATEFATTHSSIPGVKEKVQWYYPVLFAKRAHDLVEELWPIILEAANDDHYSAIMELKELYKLHKKFHILG